MSIREIEQRDGPYRYKTFMVQGWKENGRWRRRRFKSRADAEAFIASKSLENVTDSVGLRPVVTTLAADIVRQAENAVTILAAIGLPSMPSLVEAATHYAIHLRTTQSVEAVPLRDARKACQSDKETRGVLRARSAKQLESSLRLFEDWLLMLPRYRGQAVDPDWTPSVSEITSADVAAYLDSLRGKGGLIAAPKTRRNVLGDLQNFFNWCLGVEKLKSITTRRRWHSLNPTAGITAKKPASRTPDVLSVAQSHDLMRHVENYRDGYLVTFFALALFAGIRPGPDGELRKLAEDPHRDKPCREAGRRPLIDLERKIITITPDISKTGRKRIITIQPNLCRWLERYGLEILPANGRTGIDNIRADCALGHDVLRHTFISHHVAAFGSKGRTALEAGNSEAIIDAHYLNLPTEEEGKAFFSIRPAADEQNIVPMPAAEGREMA